MESNKIAKVILWIGIIEIFLAFIVGIVSGQPESSYDSFHWAIAFTWWVGGFVSGMLFLAFSEVINILHETRYYTYQNYLSHGGERKVEKETASRFESFRPNF
ncbi:hypothetical protein GCM10010913_41660 [Paenibacillus aceti]|uniref:Uncharacterized protein n=2 Tax=Paenibacillus aceti TaxID=1820010 RepID=A0ABQ1W731_9BACL|nr:hypothetical protein GCM10010913_41660 [Paenibacillus aceti]